MPRSRESRVEAGRRGGLAGTFEQRSAAGRVGAKVLHSTDTLVKRLVDRAPELTAEQIDKLRSALPPAGGEQS